MRESVDDMARPRARSATGGGRATVVALVGHAIEWYEFGVYAVVAAYVAASLFPSDDPAVSLLLVWTAYATAFVIRPLGGILLAHVADRLGRRRALFASVATMTCATTCMGLVPGYEAAGLAAPLVFVALRMAQGFAVGGEMPSATAYIAEAVDPAERTRVASWLASGTFAASLAGSALAAVLASLAGTAAMESWGWRVLFVTALPLGFVAMLVRRRAPEVGAGSETVRSPFRDAVFTQRPAIMRYIGIALVYTVGLSTTFAGILNELVLSGMPVHDAVTVNAITYAALVASILVCGVVARHWSRRMTLVIGLAGILIAVVPALALVGTGSFVLAVIGGVLLAAPLGLYATPVYVALAEMFPRRSRVTAGAIAFNLSTAVASLVPAAALGLRALVGFEHGLLVFMAIAGIAAVCALVFSPGIEWSRHA